MDTSQLFFPRLFCCPAMAHRINTQSIYIAGNRGS